MKILLVAQHYPPETARGGIGTQTWNKAHAFAELGHEVHVLSCSNDGHLSVRVTDAGITVYRIPSPGDERGREFPVYGDAAYWLGYTWNLLPELNRLMETVGPDVIDFPDYGAEGFAYLLDRSPGNWAPVVVQLHAPLGLLAEHMGWPEPGAFLDVGTFMESTAIRLADGLTACSANIADFVAQRYGVDREAIDVVYTSVDAEAFRPAENGRRHGGRPTVLFVGNLAASKGVETVLDAVLRLRPRYPDILLRIAGPEEGLSADLAERARDAGADANVELTGFVGRERLPELYRQADVFCSPALYEGGVATVFCEAMACGVPVIGSTAGGTPEAVVEGETGLLVPPVDAEAVAGALDRILGDDDLRQHMGKAARLRAESVFSIERCVDRILGSYERAIERSRAKQAEAELR